MYLCRAMPSDLVHRASQGLEVWRGKCKKRGPQIFKEIKIMTHKEKKHKRISTAMAFVALLLSVLPAHGQYMSFFGDSTWEYRVVAVSKPPELYLNNPPEEPGMLGIYCRTFALRYDKNRTEEQSFDYGPERTYYVSEEPYFQGPMPNFPAAVREDTEYGRLYYGDEIVCDMSLTEGDTFVPHGYYSFFGQRTFLVDSVRYYSGRKTICLSLLDHQDDYFFGTMYADQHADHPFSIRFIEGVGPTYGIVSGNCIRNINLGPYAQPLAQPYLTLMLCVHKDDSLVYMADEELGCVQTCTYVGISEHLQTSVMNLFPNPATQYVMLDLSTGEELNGFVVVTDIMGKVCHQQKAEGTRCRITVAELPAGMYFLTYRDSERTVTKKFLKE